MIRLIVFDLDGTLVDSHRDIADAANAVIVELGGSPLPDAAITAMVGEGAALLVRRALAAAGLDPATPGALDGFLRAYDDRLLNHTRPYDGVLDVCRTLYASRTLAVLTNKPSRHTRRILRELGFAPLLAAAIGGDTPAGRKPDPAGLRQLIADANATTSTTLLVGDSAVDLETARRAGVGICLTRYGFGFRFDGTEFRGDEYFVDSPHELLAAVDAIDRRPMLPSR